MASSDIFIGFPGSLFSRHGGGLGDFALSGRLYLGVLVCLRLITSSGNQFGSRSIPEFLGKRYQSEAVRILVSVMFLLGGGVDGGLPGLLSELHGNYVERSRI